MSDAQDVAHEEQEIAALCEWIGELSDVSPTSAPSEVVVAVCL